MELLGASPVAAVSGTAAEGGTMEANPLTNTAADGTAGSHPNAVFKIGSTHRGSSEVPATFTSGEARLS